MKTTDKVVECLGFINDDDPVVRVTESWRFDGRGMVDDTITVYNSGGVALYIRDNEEAQKLIDLLTHFVDTFKGERE